MQRRYIGECVCGGGQVGHTICWIQVISNSCHKSSGVSCWMVCLGWGISKSWAGTWLWCWEQALETWQEHWWILHYCYRWPSNSWDRPSVSWHYDVPLAIHSRLEILSFQTNSHLVQLSAYWSVGKIMTISVQLQTTFMNLHRVCFVWTGWPCMESS